jgi:hypothetical protein
MSSFNFGESEAPNLTRRLSGPGPESESRDSDRNPTEGQARMAARALLRWDTGNR